MKLLIRLLSLAVFLFSFCLYGNDTDTAYTLIEDKAKLPILTPDLSERTTLKIKLGNGLDVYLVSDPNTDKSGAVLTVDTGSWDDPEAYPGLAHFVEHLLFMGTKQHPEESGYHRFISEHDGLANAFTMNKITSFMFTVNNQALPEGLSYFSSFFKDPLLEPSRAARELQAIDQEFAKSLIEDGWRFIHVHKALAHPSHPYHNFEVGNTQTLQGVTHPFVEKWYKEHYMASRMHLMVVSSLPMEDLKTIVVSAFSDIPAGTPSPTNPYRPLFLENHNSSETISKSITYVEPIQETQDLILIWDLPPEFSDMKDTQPEGLICHVLGNEGEASLLAQLKREHLATKLSCGAQRLGDKNKELYLEIGLTDKGVREYNQVIALSFQAIANLKEKGFPTYLFEEIQRMQSVNYQYQSRPNLFDSLSMHGRWLPEEKLETYPEQTMIVQKFDPEVVQELLQSLTPQRAHYYLMAPSSLTGVPLDKREKWYGVAYTQKTIDPNLLTQWIKSTPHLAIDLPAPNPFIPYQLKLVAPSAANDKKAEQLVPRPEIILNDERGQVYHALDTRYRIPQMALLFEIKSPSIEIGSTNKVVMADLYVKALSEALISISDPARLAGLNYTVQRTNYGISIQVIGYNDNADLLFGAIVQKLKQIDPSQEDFLAYKETLYREYSAMATSSPLSQDIEIFQSILYKRFTTEKQKANVIEKVSYEQFQDYLSKIWQKSYIEGMLYGNLNREEAEKITDNLLTALNSEPYPAGKLRVPQIIQLNPNQGPFFWKTNSAVQGNAAILAIQGGKFDFKERAAQQLLMQLMKEPFFSELRTRQQTAYIVYSDSLEVRKELFNIFAVQSNTHSTQDLLARFELFIANYLQEMQQAIPSERFQKVKEALIYTLEQPPTNLEEMSFLLQKIAFEYDADWNWKEKRIQGFQELAYEEFLQKAHTLLGRENRRRVAVLLEGDLLENNNAVYQPLKSINMLRRLSDYTSP